MADALKPDFHAIYIDTNVLSGGGWPSNPPSILLNNLFRFAAYWNIKVFLPEPVLKEAYEHWLRELKEDISRLAAVKKDLARTAKPAKCEIRLEHTSTEEMIEEYKQKLDETVKEYAIHSIPFTKRAAEEIFGFATKYLMPFVHNGKGKGFQDAVILLSILDHLNAYPEAKAIFITEDKGFKEANCTDFFPGFNADRLKIVDTLEAAHKSLWQPYFDETVIKPYRQEVEAAKAAVENMEPQLKEFVGLHLDKEMLRPTYGGDTIQNILRVDGVHVLYVETPLPESGESLNRTVNMLIKVSADCTVLISRDLSYVTPFFGRLYGNSPDEVDVAPLPEQLEIQMTWYGGISATADIVDGKFANIVPKALVPDK